MSRRSELAAAMRKENARWPRVLLEIGRDEWPKGVAMSAVDPVRVFRSRDYLLQVFNERDDILRLSICRTSLDRNSAEANPIPWEDLQRLKREAGYGNLDALEIYPADKDVANVANMRHLWVVPAPITFAWRAR